MAKYLIEFNKLNSEPGDQNTEFRGRLVIEAEDSKTATKEFLEWVQQREEFATVSRFGFSTEILEIISGEEKENS